MVAEARLESGEALLIIEGEERPLRQWDFVHCPAGTTKHAIVAGRKLTVPRARGRRQDRDDLQEVEKTRRVGGRLRFRHRCDGAQGSVPLGSSSFAS
jgi:hypothetical protein